MSYTIINKQKESTGEVRISISIPAEFVNECENEALQHYQAEATLQGFRKGKAPLELVREGVSSYKLLSEAADIALKSVYPSLIEAEGLKLIAEPEAEITKLAPKNPIEVTFTLFTVPEFSLPDFKKIGREALTKEPQPEVTDMEVSETIKHVLQSRAVKNEDGTETVPELTTEFVASLGAFSSVDEFRKRISDNLLEEKTVNRRQQIRETITENLIEKTKLAMPNKLLERERAEIATHREADLKKEGLSREDYLKRISKTEKELEEQDSKYISDRFKIRHVLERIAETEKLAPEEAEIDRNVELLMKQYPNAHEKSARSYVTAALLHEKVYAFIEEPKEA